LEKNGTDYKINVCYGGHSIDTEIKNLSNPPAVLVELRSYCRSYRQRDFRLDKVQTMVLDEFDKSLQLGFHEQMSFIIGKLSKLNKRILVSATSDIEIPKYTSCKSYHSGFYSRKRRRNLSMRLVVSKEKIKLVVCLA
jgi:superfamily II DNA/RNA helicase